MTHRPKVIDLLGFDVGDDLDEICWVTEVAIVEEEFYPSLMPVLINVINTASVEGRGAADYSVDLVEGVGCVLVRS